MLNIRSSFEPSSIQSVYQYPDKEETSEPPTEDEVLDVMGTMREQATGGWNGILPEMVKYCGGLLEYVMDLFSTVWREQKVPEEWRDALIIPVPKKGDLTLCDNWWGISLLDVMRKLFAKIIQRRLQKVEVLSDSQCGFRSGRGCVDMIFCARQIVEKAREHNTKIYMLFVDLRKAYDSVP